MAVQLKYIEIDFCCYTYHAAAVQKDTYAETFKSGADFNNLMSVLGLTVNLKLADGCLRVKCVCWPFHKVTH